MKGGFFPRTFMLLFFLATGTGVGPAIGQPKGEKLFQNKCASCHTVGGGRLVGPDLAGVEDRRPEDWIRSFIRSSQDMIKSGDEYAQKRFKEFNKTVMPDQDLTDQELDALLGYIEEKGAGAEKATAETGGSEEEGDAQTDAKGSGQKAQATEKGDKDKAAVAELSQKELIEKGMDYFQGKERFDNGGPACNSCHHVNHDEVVSGGALAKELTTAYSRLGGKGIEGMLKNPAFPAMKKSYENADLTAKEIASLKAFLKEVDEEHIYQTSGNYENYFLWGGGIGILCLLFLFSLTWMKRKKDPVNQKIFKRQVRSM